MLLDGETKSIDMLSHERMCSWYFTREELEKLSPSRKDGITESKESEIRFLYCSFIRDVSVRLKLPQMTIATAIMFCHRFYLHQSLAKNGWQTIATVCVFQASKVEDTPCPLDVVVRVGYETMYRRDPVAAQRIRQKDLFEKQKALILTGERLVLTTIRFDFNIQHPYRPLHDAMKNLGIIQKEVKQVAWNFVNDWLKTTLCLQFKPQYIAAGSLYLAAKVHNIKLPLHGTHVWWHQFDVAPKPLEAVIHQMMELVSLNKLMSARPCPAKQEALSEAKLIVSNSPDSVLNQSSLSISNSSPDISEPNDHMHSGQYLINSCTADCRITGPDSSSLSVSTNRDAASASKEHGKESLDQCVITGHDDGLISCRNETTLDATATESKTEYVKQDVSHCNDFNDDDHHQASRNQHGDGVNLFSEEISQHADMDRRNNQCMELSVAKSNHCTDSLNVDTFCCDRVLANAAAGTVDSVPSARPVPAEIEADHLSVEFKKVDVARIKDLLMKRKRQRNIKLQAVSSEELSDEAWIERELESGIVANKADCTATTNELDEEAWIERELESGIVIGPSNEQVITLDGLSEDDWIERELESGIIVEPAPARKKQKLLLAPASRGYLLGR